MIHVIIIVSLIRDPVVSTIVTPYCTASWTTYCDDFSPSRMRQLAWSLDPAGQTISLQSCDGSTGCLWGDVSSSSWLCSYTSRWMVQHLATCPMTASLSQMSAAIGFAHLMVWSRALTQALVTGPSKSLDPDSGTICQLHCVSPTWQLASSRNCWRLICLAETAAH